MRLLAIAVAMSMLACERRAEPPQRRPLRAKLLTIAGEAHLRAGDHEAARASLKAAAAIEADRDLGDELPNRTAAALARIDAPANR